jgi:hypothetical protein
MRTQEKHLIVTGTQLDLILAIGGLLLVEHAHLQIGYAFSHGAHIDELMVLLPNTQFLVLIHC